MAVMVLWSSRHALKPLCWRDYPQLSMDEESNI